MRLSVPFVALLGATGAFAAPAPSNAIEGQEMQELVARQNPYAVAILSSAASALVTKAVNEAVSLIGNIANWDQAREEFTKKTVDNMWKRRPSQAGAAICYNQGYGISNKKAISDLTSVSFKKGPLHTDYDCFYMWGPNNHFNSNGDGGYINLAVVTRGDKCTFDGKTSDVYCK